MIKHYNLKVFGTVQGVYFRASTKVEAERLNIKGFVKNEADGTVYLEAEGEEQQLEELMNWCKIGSKHAEVEKVEIEVGTIKGFQLFDIQR